MKKKSKSISFLIMILLFVFAGNTTFVLGQKQKDKPEVKKSKIKNYEEVITKDVKTSPGIFKMHNIENKWYYEIPNKELSNLFLWVTQLKKEPAKMRYGGVAYNNQVARWDKKNDQVLLRRVMYSVVANENSAVYHSVDASTFPTILIAFDITAFGPDSSIVIDVTDFMTAEKIEFVPKKTFNAKRLDLKRSYIEKISAYPENIEADVVLAFEVDDIPGNPTLSMYL